MAQTNRPRTPREGVHVIEDFLTNDSITDAAIGRMLWEADTIANASTMAYLESTTAVAPGGGMRFTTNGTADGDGESLRLNTDGIVLGPNGGGFAFGCRFPSVTGNVLAGQAFRVGLDDSVTATSPTVGIWVEAPAGVVSLQVDSADHGDLSAAAGSYGGDNSLTSNTTMVLGTTHHFQVDWFGENAQGGPAWVNLAVDDQQVAQTKCNIDNDEEMELKIVHWQDSGGAATLELDVLYYEFWMFR